MWGPPCEAAAREQAGERPDVPFLSTVDVRKAEMFRQACRKGCATGREVTRAQASRDNRLTQRAASASVACHLPQESPFLALVSCMWQVAL